MILEKKAALQKDEIAMSTNTRVKSAAQYRCLLQNRESHRFSTVECLKERSHSEIMGQFIFYDSDRRIPKKSLHLYVLYTLESSQNIIRGCRMATTVIAALSTHSCENSVQIYKQYTMILVLPESYQSR
uniref:AlNc14C52G4073 protein n=1 Tax=Albugo laibachii Nc14 TaxID=890382 RepID=F0WBM8_9STRA|nr:AlNc14C52G4073 [Albugo laibachii Nc14]|eukprot:CCA18555.1 AlNc14C52G4073 [Albugo laibachii Nc14]